MSVYLCMCVCCTSVFTCVCKCAPPTNHLVVHLMAGYVRFGALVFGFLGLSTGATALTRITTGA